MAEKPPQDIFKQPGGFFKDTMIYIKLIIRLMSDKRVPTLLKLLPIGSILYVLWPLDLLPGPIPIDDAAALGLGMYLFIEFCPKDIVEEHLNSLEDIIPGRKKDKESEKWEANDVNFSSDNIIDAEYHDKDKNEGKPA
jgi:uncharacterized membrane protein YkvA (DUF1232 family)